MSGNLRIVFSALFLFTAQAGHAQESALTQLIEDSLPAHWAMSDVEAMAASIQESMDLQMESMWRSCPGTRPDSLPAGTHERLRAIWEASRKHHLLGPSPSDPGAAFTIFGNDQVTPFEGTFQVDQFISGGAISNVLSGPMIPSKEWDRFVQDDVSKMGAYRIQLESEDDAAQTGTNLMIANGFEGLDLVINAARTDGQVSEPVLVSFSAAEAERIAEAYAATLGLENDFVFNLDPRGALYSLYGPGDGLNGTFTVLDDVLCPEETQSVTGLPPIRQSVVAEFLCKQIDDVAECSKLVHRVIAGTWAVFVLSEDEFTIADGVLTVSPVITALEQFDLIERGSGYFCGPESGEDLTFQNEMRHFLGSRPGLALCGGVMVQDPEGSDAPLFLSASHCLRKQTGTGNRVFLVGDYFMQSPGLDMSTLQFRSRLWIEVTDLAVQSFAGDNQRPDLAVIRLPQEMVADEILNQLSVTPSLAMNEGILARGFPSGVPRLTMDPAETAVRLIESEAFYAEIDSLRRSSGSPVFNSKGQVIGILAYEEMSTKVVKVADSGCIKIVSIPEVSDAEIKDLLPRIEFAGQICNTLACK